MVQGFVFVVTRLNASEVPANSVPCAEETNDIPVISEEELRRGRLGLPPEPDLKQAVEEDRQAGGRGLGGAGDLGRTPQVPAALLMSQENQEAEEPERDQLVIRDGQEEEQDADEEGERVRGSGLRLSHSLLPDAGKVPRSLPNSSLRAGGSFCLFGIHYQVGHRRKEQCTPQHLDVSEIVFRESSGTLMGA